MTHYRLHHLKEAQALLSAAARRADAKVPKAGLDDLAEQNVENWLVCQVARREAESLVGAAADEPLAPASQPRE